MKKNFSSRMLSMLVASFMLVAFTNCTRSAHENDDMKTSKRNSNSFNLKKEYHAYLSPLNNSGVTGTARLMLDGNMLTVTITASGLTPNRVHPQHIHGFTENNKSSTCPGPSADTNGDGLVDLMEGAPFYGPVLLSLTPFPTADANGNITYTQTFPVTADMLPLQNRAIVLHGMMVNGEYWASLPVACGKIMSGGM